MATIKIKIEQGQSLLDLAIQFYGNTEGLVALAQDNNYSLTTELIPGDTILLDDSKIINRQLVDYFAKNRTSIVTNEK